MTKIIWLFLVLGYGCMANAQTVDARDNVRDSAPATVTMTPDTERLRINAQRAKLEAGFDLENAACYEKFLVSNCLDGIKLRRRDALADLRRQEVALNALERKSKAAGQIKKTEEKSSAENQQQEAEKRASALRDFQARMDREKQKNTARAEAQANASGDSAAMAERIKSQQEKVVARSSKQAAAAEEVRKFNERQEKAKERRAQHDQDVLKQTKRSRPLPVPD